MSLCCLELMDSQVQKRTPQLFWSLVTSAALFSCVFIYSHRSKAASDSKGTKLKRKPKERDRLQSLEREKEGKRMAGDAKKTTLRGCIKKSKGPWIVHRTTKAGKIVTRHRFPTENERQKNKQRESRRRAVAKKIFAGLKEHGGYELPKHAETNDLLKALCEEAGWHVEEDGTIYRKNIELQKSVAAVSGSMIHSSCPVIENGQSKEQDYCTCNNHGNVPAFGNFLSMGQYLNLKLSSQFQIPRPVVFEKKGWI